MTSISQLSYMYNNGYFSFLFNMFSDAFYLTDIRVFINNSSWIPLPIAYKITYYYLIINSLHAIYSLLLSLPLAHKCMYIISYMFYTASIWVCL